MEKADFFEEKETDDNLMPFLRLDMTENDFLELMKIDGQSSVSFFSVSEGQISDDSSCFAGYKFYRLEQVFINGGDSYMEEKQPDIVVVVSPESGHLYIAGQILNGTNPTAGIGEKMQIEKLMN